MNISLAWYTVWKVIVDLYYTSTVPVRFAYICWIVFCSLYLFLGSYERKHGLTPKRRTRKQNYPGTLYLFGGVTLLIHHGSLNWGWMFYARICEPGNFFALGLSGFALLFLGLFLVAAGRLEIDGLWGLHIFEYTDPDDSRVRLVTTGIFRHCRHPVYAGQIAMTIGTVLLLNNWWGTILPVGTTLLCIWRAKREEVDLLDRFSNTFEYYRDTTSFIVPWIGWKKNDD